MKKKHKLSIAALTASLLPLSALIPALFHVTLGDTIRFLLAGINIFSVFAGLVLSVICVKNRDSRSVINIISTVISSFWILLICGIVSLSLFLSFGH